MEVLLILIGGGIKDGKIYGVGTGDSHGNLAAFFGAINAIIRSDIKLRGDTTVDELGYKLGAKRLRNSLAHSTANSLSFIKR